MKKKRLRWLWRSLALLVALVFVSFAIVSCCFDLEFAQVTKSKMKQSTQYSDGVFKSGNASLSMSFGEYVSGTYDYFLGKSRKNRTPDRKLPRATVDLSHFESNDDDYLSATWLGHSSLLLNMDGKRIVTDPVFENKISVVGPTRFSGNTPIDPGTIRNIDVIIISHDHYDHLNKASVRLLAEHTSRFVVPLGVSARLTAWGINADKVIELDWWESYQHDEELEIVATPAQHFSGRGVGDRNKTLWASWVVKSPKHNIFFSGDSGYFNGFKKIGDKYGPFDMTFMECGAYNESWKTVHMFPEETVQAHLDVKGGLLHPIHWGTFNLALHSWDDPMVRLVAAAKENDVPISTPIVGETTVPGKKVHTTEWWVEE